MPVVSPGRGHLGSRRRALPRPRRQRRRSRHGAPLPRRRMICCETLGPPMVRLDDGSVPASLQWHKNLALLVYLARSPKRARARDHLIGLLWGDEAEKDARHSLNQAVSTLRAYAGESIETDRTHVRLADGAVSLDVEQLDACGAAGDYEAAARLIAGVFLEGFSISGASGFDDWMASERTHWQRRSVEILACLSTQASVRGDLRGAEEAASYATSWTVTWWCRASAGGFSRLPDALPPPRPVRGASPATTAGPLTRSASP